MNVQTLRKAMQEGYQFSSYTSESQIEDVIRWKICDAMKLRGQANMDESMIVAMCRKTAEVLLRDYPSMTDKEFEIMLEAGISGELTPKETWVSGAMILQWMRLYYRHTSRISIIDEQNEEEQKSHRLTKEEKEQRNEKAYKDSYEKGLHCYRQNGTIFHKEGFAMAQWPAMLYDEYRRRGVIGEPTDDDRKYAAKKAEVHNLEHPLKFQLSAESMKIHHEDIIKAYLLEAHYSDQLPI